jgi:hypothetical protein
VFARGRQRQKQPQQEEHIGKEKKRKHQGLRVQKQGGTGNEGTLAKKQKTRGRSAPRSWEGHEHHLSHRDHFRNVLHTLRPARPGKRELWSCLRTAKRTPCGLLPCPASQDCKTSNSQGCAWNGKDCGTRRTVFPPRLFQPRPALQKRL